MFINLFLTTLLTLSAAPTSSGRITQGRQRHNGINSRSVHVGPNATVTSWTITDPTVAYDMDDGPSLAKRDKRKHCEGECSKKRMTKITKDNQHPAKNKSNRDERAFQGGESSSGHRLIQVEDSKCGPSRATWPPTVASGPNGHIDWIDCGISATNPKDDHGWTPPTVTLNELVYMDLGTALRDPKTPFGACRKYLDSFTRVAGSKGLPAILLASFAMQESTCNPKATGKGGEVGMFQLAPENCKGVSREECYEQETNMRLAAEYIQAQIHAAGGSILLMIGNYNGWNKGMTYQDGTKARHSSCCYCQNNLDYVHQVVNGWLQNTQTTWYGENGNKLSSPVNLGTFNNLNVCGRKRSLPPIESMMIPRNPGGWRF
ncbi:hypothetical protein FRB97_006221 [Tulasnella sp. 331]|nr:hypothetical protein FRB97_006221 [Tulasnella sp. 331]